MLQEKNQEYTDLMSTFATMHARLERVTKVLQQTAEPAGDKSSTPR